MSVLQISPPQLSDVANVPWEIQKSHFSASLFIYSRFTLPQKKTNSSCCTSTETLGVYLLSFSASYYLLSPGAASGACYRRSVCIATDMLSLAAVACCDIGWILAQRVYYVTDQCQKRLEACITAEGGHSEHLLAVTLLACQLPQITTGSFQSHQWQPTTGSLQSLQCLKEHNEPSSQMKRFWNSQVSVVIISGGVGK